MGVALPGGGYLVGQPAGGRDDGNGKHQAGARVKALLHRLLEPGVQPAPVANTGVARLQGLLQDLGRAQVLEGQGGVEAHATGQAVVLGGQVVMAVNHPGHQGHAADVDDFGALGQVYRLPGPGLDYPFAVDENGRVIDHRSARAVYQVGSHEGFHKRTSHSGSGQRPHNFQLTCGCPAICS